MQDAGTALQEGQILVVEDDEEIVEVLTIAAGDGVETLERLKRS